MGAPYCTGVTAVSDAHPLARYYQISAGTYTYSGLGAPSPSSPRAQRDCEYLDAIAAVVIGGTLLRGGVGYLPGTLIGVLILGIIQTLITFKGDLNTWWTKIAIGGLLLVFIMLQQAISRRGAR